MGKRNKKARKLVKHKDAANNIVPINRELFGMVKRSEMHDYSMYVIARNAARMLISESIDPELFELAMQDEINYMEAQE